MSIFSRWTADESVSYVPGDLNKRYPEIEYSTVRGMLGNHWKGQ